MKSFKKIILFLHRWLGLITGVVVFILGVTGCIYVFQPEITHWKRHDLLYVDSPQQQPLPVKVLQKKAAKALGVEYLPYGLTTYKNPGRTWSAMYYKGGVESWTYFGSIKDYRTLYINPYTGEIAGIVNEEEAFFQIIKAIHWSLLLSTPIGQPITAWSTLIFIILLISGVVLWWPKRWSKAGRKKSFTIRWKGTWRRINYDLHNVLGFYFFFILLIIGLTGLYWYFPKLFADPGSQKPPSVEQKIVEDKIEGKAVERPVQVAYKKAWSLFPHAYNITIVAPRDSSDTIQAGVRAHYDTYNYEGGILKFDSKTAQIVSKKLYANLSTVKKILAINYGLHVGAIGGMAVKIMFFFASLLAASLPVTGFIIWWDRRKRKQRREKKKRMKISEIAKRKKERKVISSQ